VIIREPNGSVKKAECRVFQMTVDSAIKVHENLTSVAGPCLNKHKFKSLLVDNLGNVY